jgi:hypothetical protein
MTRSLRIAVVVIVVISLIIFAIAVVVLFLFIFIFFLVWLLSREDIGSYQEIRRGWVGVFWIYSAHIRWYAVLGDAGIL